LLVLVPTFALADVDVTRPNATPNAATLRAGRSDLAAKGYADALSRMKAGAESVETVMIWSSRWRDAEAAVSTDPSAAATAAGRHFERAKLVEGLARERVATGTMRPGEANAALWWRTDAELATLK
jgi:hypothetical protein